jgi:hypothetical protein
MGRASGLRIYMDGLLDYKAAKLGRELSSDDGRAEDLFSFLSFVLNRENAGVAR